MTSRTDPASNINQPDLPIVIGVLLAALVFVVAVKRGSPLAEISSDDWICTATHTEQRPVETAQGTTYRTVYACDQWSRR